MELLEPTVLPDWFAGWLKPLAEPSDDGSEPNASARGEAKLRAGASGSSRTKKPPPPAVTSVRLSSVRARPVEWLWPGWLPLGKLCDLSGDPGLSKSTLLLDLAARISTNGVMPDGSQGVSGGVCIMSAEDGLEDTIQPRLRAAGADLARVGFFEAYNRAPLVLPDHIDRIEVRLRDYEARLLIIDPLVAFLAQARSDQEVRKCLHPLKLLAERLRCTVLWLRHLSKRGGPKAIYRGSGHVSIIGAARSGLIVGPDPGDLAVRVLAHAKSNLAPRQQSLTYTLEKVDEFGCCRVVWRGPSDLSADDLCETLSRKEKEQRENAESRTDAAMLFLTEALRDGPRVVEELKEEAKLLGLAWATVRRAIRIMGVTTYHRKQTASRQYEWGLPSNSPRSTSV
jgi:AAA domain